MFCNITFYNIAGFVKWLRVTCCKPTLFTNVDKTSKPVVNSGDTISENSYFLRAASFKNENDATNLKTKLSRNGYSVSLQPVKINSEKWVRVLVGPFHTIKEAFIAKNALLRDGLKADMIKGNKN